jgi:hypothetical protein
VPCPRSSCAAAICGDSLLVHGGQTGNGAVLGDMHLLQLNCLTWLQVRAAAAAAAASAGTCKYQHTACVALQVGAGPGAAMMCSCTV